MLVIPMPDGVCRARNPCGRLLPAGFLILHRRAVEDLTSGGDPPLFLQVLISGDFKSNDFVTADSTEFAATFFVTADSKGLARVETRQSVTVSESVASAKLLAGFAPHVTSAGIPVNRKTALRPKKGEKREGFRLIRGVLPTAVRFNSIRMACLSGPPTPRAGSGA